MTWKCHKEGLCYAQIATIRLNWYKASDFCKNLSNETGIADKWKTGMAAPADIKYLKEIAKAFGHENDWDSRSRETSRDRRDQKFRDDTDTDTLWGPESRPILILILRLNLY